MKTIVGLFDDITHANKAAADLENAGITRNDISIAANNEGGKYVANSDGSHSDTTTTGGAIGSDAAIGATVGGAAGLLIGLTGLAIPGLGWIATAGWLTATLIGAGTGAVVGGLVGALTSVGVPEEDATLYNEGVRRGGILVAVRAEDNQAHRVAEILGDNGAVNIDERAAQYRSGATAMPATAMAGAPAMPALANATHAAGTAVHGETVIPVIEESLQVGKREVQRGGVRVYSHVIETPVHEQVTLREEHVTVNRQPVDRALTDADRAGLQQRTVEVTARAEEAVVAKEARVVEEITVGKQATQHTENITDTVRRTDVKVEQIPGQTGTTGATATATTADTRGVVEKVEDAVTGDRVDDKTGNRI